VAVQREWSGCFIHATYCRAYATSIRREGLERAAFFHEPARKRVAKGFSDTSGLSIISGERDVSLHYPQRRIFMKQMLIALVLATPCFAGSPPELGNFEGLLFTGAATRQEFSFQAGSFSDCNTEKREGSTYHKCHSNGEIVVGAGGHSPERYTLERVVVLESKTVHYYYRGSRTIRIGDRDIVQRVSVTVSPTPKQAGRITGYLELSDLELRSGFEAYRKETP